MTSDTPLTDAVDAANAPDTNGNDGWKMAYFAMMKHACIMERELSAVSKLDLRKDKERLDWALPLLRGVGILPLDVNGRTAIDAARSRTRS